MIPTLPQPMTTKKALLSVLYLALCSIFPAGAQVQPLAAGKPGTTADASGTWTWTTPLAKGVPERRHVLTLKVDGDVLTGTLLSPGAARSGNATPIIATKWNHDTISFTVTRQLGTNLITQRFSGTLTNDTIKGNVTFDVSGKTNSARWVAKRQPEGGTQDTTRPPKGAISRPGSAGAWQFPTFQRKPSQNSNAPPASASHAQ